MRAAALRRQARRGQRGQVLLVMALSLVVLCGGAAIAIDLGSAASARRDLQAYADFASLAGAQSLGTGTDAANYVALVYLSRELGFAPPSPLAPLTGSGGLPSCSAPTAGSCPAGTYTGRSTSSTITLTDTASTIDVAVGSTRSTLLAGVLGFGSVNVASSSRAGAGRRSCGICILSNDDPAENAIRLTGNGSVYINGADVVDDSNNPTSAATISGNGSLIVTSPNTLGIVGGYSASSKGGYSPLPTTGVSVVPDPLAGVPQPTNSPPLTNYGSVSLSGILNPGVYSSISANSGTTMVLNPGLYVFTGNGLTSSGNGNISGTGVTLYFACSNWPSPCAPGTAGSAITLSGNGVNTFTACTTSCVNGAIQGMALFADRNNTASMKLTGNGLIPVITGSIYGRSANVTLTGGSQMILNSAMVIDSLVASGSGDVDNNIIPGADVPGLITGGANSPTTILR